MKKQVLAIGATLVLSAVCFGAMRAVPAKAVSQETAAVVVGGTAIVQQGNEAPEFPSYTDPVMEVSIEEEETPL